MSTQETRRQEIKRLVDEEGHSVDEVALMLGLSRKTVANRLQESRSSKDESQTQDKPPSAGPEMPKDAKETIDRNADGSYVSERPLWMKLEDIRDPDKLLSAHDFDPETWELVTARNNRWNAYSKQDGILTLYASKITVKPRASGKSDEEWQKFFETLSSRFRSPVHTPTNYSPNGKLLELNIADLHLGKLAWSGDSGDTYNHEIARERFFYIINDIITRTQTYKFERILFVWCNDFYHFDGPGKTTTAGTPQDASLQYEQMFELGSEMLVQGIDLLNQIAPVMTMYVASNHDRLISFFATKYLAAWYRDNPHVTVDSRALSRKAVRFGVNLVGFTHGHLEKKQMGSWLSVDYRKDWGETLYHEVHAAHVHSEKSIEESNGQITRFVSSPTGTDRWHHDSAYTGAIQKGQSFIWDREMGLEDTKNTTILVKGQMREGVVL